MKNKSSNEKVTIYLAIFFIIFLVVILVLYFLGIIGGEKDTVNVILDSDIMVEYSNDKWSKLKTSDYEKYSWNKYYVYEEGKQKTKDKYSVYISGKDFLVFLEKNNNRTPILTTDDSIYLGGKKESKFIEFKKEEIEDKDKNYINSIFKQNSISQEDYNNYVRGYKVVSDFDNDDEKETMYVLSNTFAYKINKTAYSLIFIKDNDNTKYIYKNIVDSSKRYSICSATLLGLIKIDDVNNLQIITKCGYFSNTNNNEYGVYQNRFNTYEVLLYIK